MCDGALQDGKIAWDRKMVELRPSVDPGIEESCAGPKLFSVSATIAPEHDVVSELDCDEGRSAKEMALEYLWLDKHGAVKPDPFFEPCACKVGSLVEGCTTKVGAFCETGLPEVGHGKDRVAERGTPIESDIAEADGAIRVKALKPGISSEFRVFEPGAVQDFNVPKIGIHAEPGLSKISGSVHG